MKSKRRYGLFILLLCLAAGGATMAETHLISFQDLLNRPASAATKRLAYGSGADQFGDLWLPGGSGPHQVIILIHGGCWQASLPGVELMAPIAEDLRKSGFAVWNVEYSRIGPGKTGYPDTFLDIAKGIDFLRTMQAAYKLDLSKLIVVGHSAGGHLALWAAARSHLKPDSKLFSADPLPIKFVVTLAGINDLKAYRETGPSACGGPNTIDQLVNLRNRPHEDVYADTSPAALLPVGVPQLIVAGKLDPIVPDQFAIDYATLAKSRGDQVKIMNIEEAGHFELIDPESAAWKQIKAVVTAF